FNHPPHPSVVHPNCCQLWRVLFEDIELTIKAFVFEDFANLPACKLGRLHEIDRRCALFIIIANAVAASCG
ncbi:MAG: hypothetical protein P8O84_02290, partial [Synechococcus sp. cluster3_bin.96]|nr:hypothetical protein [Synechococcus sp. cluster3_bin.96]